MEVPEPVGIARRPVSVHPGPRQPAPVRVQVALAVRGRPAPETPRHPRPRRPDRQLADLVDDRAPTGIDDLRRHPDARSVERCRADRAEGRRADDPAGDLGPAAVVDDRQASFAHGLEEPRPRVRIPRLPGRAEDAERAPVVVADRRVAVNQERADQRRAHAQVGDAVPLDERPDAAGVGVIRGAFEHHEASPNQERAADRPGTHHPAEVGDPAQGVAGPQVEGVGQVLRGLDRETAVDMDGALRSPGRPGRVDDHVGGLGIDRPRRSRHRAQRRPLRRVRFAVPRGVPQRVGQGRREAAGLEAPHDQDPADARRVRERLRRQRGHRDRPAPPKEAIRGHQVCRLERAETGGDGRSGVAAEDRREDRAKPSKGQDDDRRLGEHRQEDPDAGPGTDPVRRKAVGGRLDGRDQTGPGDTADQTVIALPGDRLVIGSRGPPRQHGGGVVERPSDPPARPFDPLAQVQDPVPAAAPGEFQVVDSEPPEPGRIGNGPGLERLQVGRPAGADEPGRATVGKDLGARAPGGTGIGTREGGQGGWPAGRAGQRCHRRMMLVAERGRHSGRAATTSNRPPPTGHSPLVEPSLVRSDPAKVGVLVRRRSTRLD